MTRLEKCEMAKSMGYVYDPYSGFVYNKKGRQMGTINSIGYVVLTNPNNFGLLKLHHYAWYWVYGNVDFDLLDHINRIKTDNRICNLRIISKQQNHFNTNAKGYYWSNIHKKYRVQLVINRKNIYGGCFNTEEEARNRYLELKKLYHIID